jgi:uncharacterized membrane protein
MLVGIAFLLKFLYDRNWIGPAGRVAIGMASGIALLLLGEFRLRKQHDLLSQSVSATGCGALFLTTFLSFKFYEFSSRGATFALLCWFALFTVALAVLRRGRVLGFLGLIGAYLTPYLLSTGQDQAEGLFAYLAALAVAAAGVQAMRGWPGIPSLCLAFTWIYYVAWFANFYRPGRLPTAVAGAAGLAVAFGCVALTRGLWNRAAARIEECVVLAASAVAGVYYLWEILVNRHAQALGFMLCAISLAALGALRAARSRHSMTPPLANTLLALATGSLLLVIPACLEADAAMLAWSFGAVVLAGMGARSRLMLLDASAGLCLIAGIRAGAGQGVAHTGLFVPAMNRVFLAWFCTALSWFLVGLQYVRQSSRGTPVPQRRTIGLALQVAASFMLIGLLTYEALAWFRAEMQIPGADPAELKDWRTVVLCLLWALYPVVWLRLESRHANLWILSVAHYAVWSLAFLSLLFDFHHREPRLFLNPVFVAALMLPAAVFMLGRRVAHAGPRAKDTIQVSAHFLFLVLISVELYQGLFLTGSPPATRYWIRMALISTAWALYATGLLIVGISRDLRAWRWSALVLFCFTLLKVFFLDMAEVRQIWRVLSFMILGALLMACSYAYSRQERRRRRRNERPTTSEEVTP